ncbi:EmrKY-TolC multidrug resistance efflux pump, membrane fusion protein component [Escherichia coli]|nr:EmrKY-TolC multidrug resistance efflux pump, membrane fusion protein component [Escherichia coli]
MISTDDAYVTGNADPISAQVSGSVTVVNHKDTNYVRQGDILVSLDKTDATIALNKAKNNLANIVRQTGNDSNLLIVFYVQIMPDDFVMQLHRF